MKIKLIIQLKLFLSLFASYFLCHSFFLILDKELIPLAKGSAGQDLHPIHSLKDLLPFIEGEKNYQDDQATYCQKLKVERCQLLIASCDDHSLQKVNLAEDFPIRQERTVTKGEVVTRYPGIGFEKSDTSWFQTEKLPRDEMFFRLFMLAQFCKIPSTLPGPLSDPLILLLSQEETVDLAEHVLVEKINQYRQSLQLPPWREDKDLMKLAKQHAENMLTRQSMDHQNFAKRAEWIQKNHGPKVVLENVAMNQFMINPFYKVFEQWRDSPGHHKNMISPWSDQQFGHTGLGIAVGENGQWYFAQIFSINP